MVIAYNHIWTPKLMAHDLSSNYVHYNQVTTKHSHGARRLSMTCLQHYFNWLMLILGLNF